MKEQILKEFYRTNLRYGEDVVDNTSTTIAKVLDISASYVSNVINSSLAEKENALNGIVKVKKVQSSKYLGVSYDKVRKKYRAQITLENGRKKYLGVFFKAEDAHFAYVKYKTENTLISEIEVEYELISA